MYVFDEVVAPGEYAGSVSATDVIEVVYLARRNQKGPGQDGVRWS